MEEIIYAKKWRIKITVIFKIILMNKADTTSRGKSRKSNKKKLIFKLYISSMNIYIILAIISVICIMQRKIQEERNGK